MVRLRIHIEGPTGWQSVSALLDTGAARTVIHPEILGLVGYDLHGLRQSQTIVTASRNETMGMVTVRSIAALGQTMHDHAVGAFPLPAATGAQALLGLDFFADRRLTIDFRAGTVELQ